MYSKQVISIGFLLSLLIVPCAGADSLTEVLQSDSMESVVKVTKQNEMKIKKKNLDEHRWINPKSTFGKLFTKNKHAENMIEWLSAATGEYKIKKPTGLKGKIYAYAEWRLKQPKKPLVFAKVMVPHPKYVEMVLFGLIEDFNTLYPLEAETVHRENLKISEQPARLFKMKNGHCSLVIDGPRHSKIQFYQRECEDMNVIVSLAKMLDMTRFKRKLGKEPDHLIARRKDNYYDDAEKAKPKDLPPAMGRGTKEVNKPAFVEFH